MIVNYVFLYSIYRFSCGDSVHTSVTILKYWCFQLLFTLHVFLLIRTMRQIKIAYMYVRNTQTLNDRNVITYRPVSGQVWNCFLPTSIFLVPIRHEINMSPLHTSLLKTCSRLILAENSLPFFVFDTLIRFAKFNL